MKELWWENKDIVSLMIKLTSKELDVWGFKNLHIYLTALSDLLSDHIIQTSLFWWGDLLVVTTREVLVETGGTVTESTQI